MTQRRVRRTGLVLLILALALRLVLWLGAKGLQNKVVQTLSSPEFSRMMLAVFTATDLAEEALNPEPTVWVIHKLASREAAEGSPKGDSALAFASSDAAAVTVSGACTYSVPKLSLLQKETPLEKTDAPTVLIIHTHSSEAYTPSAGLSYPQTDSYRTLWAERSVVAVGTEVKEALEARGISVVHDTTVNDYPDYNGAYTRTGKKIEDWLEKYPSIQIVLDLHRDALLNADGSAKRTITTLKDGETSAQLMLVVGTDQGGSKHPYWQENLAWALKLQVLLERENPGICRNLDLRTERFNQHYTPKSMLVEVGNIGNTLPEALAAARVFGETLADLIEASAQ